MDRADAEAQAVARRRVAVVHPVGDEQPEVDRRARALERVLEDLARRVAGAEVQPLVQIEVDLERAAGILNDILSLS